MQNKNANPTLYENVVTVSFLLFVQAMKLYSEFGNHVADNPEIITNAKIQKGLGQIIETMNTCGNSLERLPDPPQGAEEADRHFRELGNEICNLTSILSDLDNLTSAKEQRQVSKELIFHLERVKQKFHEAIQSFELVYPGQLSSNLTPKP